MTNKQKRKSSTTQSIRLQAIWVFFISTLLSFLQKAPYFFLRTRIKIGFCEDTTGAESKEGLWGSGFVRCVTKAWCCVTPGSHTPSTYTSTGVLWNWGPYSLMIWGTLYTGANWPTAIIPTVGILPLIFNICYSDLWQRRRHQLLRQRHGGEWRQSPSLKTRQIHYPTTPKQSPVQVVICTFTTLWNNNA